MVTILPMGERALLVEVATLEEVLALRDGLERSRPPGVRDLVPAARTVLVEIDTRALPLVAARAWIESVAQTTPAARDASTSAAPVVLDIRYDGPDLAETAELLGLSAAELVARHCAAEWTVAFTGFAPGFGYLVSGDWPYDIPRLDAPRTRVPAGAVGLAAEFSGAYPRETPGGWRLIGTTTTVLFDQESETPVLLSPGARVLFRAVPA